MGSFSGTQRNALGADPVARADTCQSATDSIFFGTSASFSALAAASDCVSVVASGDSIVFFSGFETSSVALGGVGGVGDAVDRS
jgi:hypothetical protein